MQKQKKTIILAETYKATELDIYIFVVYVRVSVKCYTHMPPMFTVNWTVAVHQWTTLHWFLSWRPLILVHVSRKWKWDLVKNVHLIPSRRLQNTGYDFIEYLRIKVL